MKNCRLIVIMALLLFGSTNIFATAQYPDKIIYDGKEHSLHSNPLEPYFAKFPERKPKNGIMSSALWRGYVATFEFLDNSLFLKDVQIKVQKNSESRSFETEWKSVISEVLPNKEKLKIDWLTGILVIPHGKIVNYVHMGYASTYENYVLLEVENGDLKKTKEFDYKEYEAFKHRQFEAFKKTEEYMKLAQELLKRENATEEFVESFLRSAVISYTSKILID